jgi:hypothetical protein
MFLEGIGVKGVILIGNNNNGNGEPYIGGESREDTVVAQQDRLILPQIPYPSPHEVQYKEAIEFFKKAERIVEE